MDFLNIARLTNVTAWHSRVRTFSFLFVLFCSYSILPLLYLPFWLIGVFHVTKVTNFFCFLHRLLSFPMPGGIDFEEGKWCNDAYFIGLNVQTIFLGLRSRINKITITQTCSGMIWTRTCSIVSTCDGLYMIVRSSKNVLPAIAEATVWLSLSIDNWKALREKNINM